MAQTKEFAVIAEDEGRVSRAISGYSAYYATPKSVLISECMQVRRWRAGVFSPVQVSVKLTWEVSSILK